eukprot:399421-Pyramimonas_sp.AAC.1
MCPPFSRQLSWESFLDGLLGIREASRILFAMISERVRLAHVIYIQRVVALHKPVVRVIGHCHQSKLLFLGNRFAPDLPERLHSASPGVDLVVQNCPDGHVLLLGGDREASLASDRVAVHPIEQICGRGEGIVEVVLLLAEEVHDRGTCSFESIDLDRHERPAELPPARLGHLRVGCVEGLLAALVRLLHRPPIFPVNASQVRHGVIHQRWQDPPDLGRRGPP